MEKAQRISLLAKGMGMLLSFTWSCIQPGD